MSDLDCFKELYCVNRSYVRIEQYNDKQIGIAKLSNEEVHNLLSDEKRKVITFNLWQIVKHIALEERNAIVHELFNKETTNTLMQSLNLDEDNLYMALHYIYFGLDYSNWREGLKVFYKFDKILQCCEKIEEEVCQLFIEHVLKIVLQREQGCMYRQYCKNVVNSFLYGNAKNVEDMLFLHLLKRGLINVEIEENGILNVNIEQYMQQNIHLADKRVYESIMNNYDTRLLSTAEKLIVDSTIEKNEADRRIVFGNIKHACENLDYTYSDLYQMCVYELEEAEA